MQRIDIAALREALAKADRHDAQGEWIQRDATQVRLCQQLPALLDEIEALRARTTPEVIGDRHKNGNWWLGWDAGNEKWVECRWSSVWGSWERGRGVFSMSFAPTHALPMPPEVPHD
jgi:hypothetical protein